MIFACNRLFLSLSLCLSFLNFCDLCPFPPPLSFSLSPFFCVVPCLTVSLFLFFPSLFLSNSFLSRALRYRAPLECQRLSLSLLVSLAFFTASFFQLFLSLRLFLISSLSLFLSRFLSSLFLSLSLFLFLSSSVPPSLSLPFVLFVLSSVISLSRSFSLFQRSFSL